MSSKAQFNSLSDVTYKAALDSSWEVQFDVEKTFPAEVCEWIKKKSTELGVPYSYIAFPFLTSVAYCLGASNVKVTESYKEPIILYSLISGRSGTNKSGSLSIFRDIVGSIPCTEEPENEEEEADKNEKREQRRQQERQHVFDSGTMEGLMTTLKENGGSVLCAVDEFSTFLDSMDKGSNGSAERSRYLSLWSGIPWSKKTKHGGLESIESPRFQFVGFNQNYFLINMIINSNHFDGFLPRFLIATSSEVYISLKEKIECASKPDELDAKDLIHTLFRCFNDGFEFIFSEKALEKLCKYHDDVVLEFRKQDKYEDTKSMIMSKSISNVIRVSGIQSAVRGMIDALKKDEVNDVIDLQVEEIDIERALTIVKYSVDCMFALIDVTMGKRSLKRHAEIPDVEVMDAEFLIQHKSKIQRMYAQETRRIPFSQITRNHIYPQVGGKCNKDNAKKFLMGLEKFGIGTLHQGDGEKPVFELTDKENIPTPELRDLYLQLGIV